MKTFFNTTDMNNHSHALGEGGIVAMEGLFIMMVFLALAFGIVEFGSVIHAQTTVTHIAREGGNLASRDLNAGTDLLNLLESSSSSLEFAQNPDSYRMFLMPVLAGGPVNNEPTCPTISERGTLSGSHIISPQSELNCGLTPELATYLTHDGTNVQISRLTVVKVYYHHKPITPLGTLVAGAMFGGRQNNMSDIILTSKSIF